MVERPAFDPTFAGGELPFPISRVHNVQSRVHESMRFLMIMMLMCFGELLFLVLVVVALVLGEEGVWLLCLGLLGQEVGFAWMVVLIDGVRLLALLSSFSTNRLILEIDFKILQLFLSQLLLQLLLLVLRLILLILVYLVLLFIHLELFLLLLVLMELFFLEISDRSHPLFFHSLLLKPLSLKLPLSEFLVDVDFYLRLQ